MGNYSSLILKYTKKLKKDPSSLVFAPLGEIYIKMGEYDKALSILQEGIKLNPGNLSGYICLAECYLLKNQPDLAIATLRPLAYKFCENLKLQRIYADACYQAGEFDSSLEAYKRILFVNPQNRDVAQLVGELEKQLNNSPVVEEMPRKLYSEGKYLEQNPNLEFPVDRLDVEDDIGQWVPLNTISTKENKEDSSDTQCNTSKDNAKLSYQKQEDENQEDWNDEGSQIEQSVPIYTRSLLQLYMSQSLWKKSKEVALFLVTQETSVVEKEKLNELIQQIDHNIEQEIAQSGGEQLMEFFDKKIAPDIQDKRVKIEAKLLKFLEKIKSYAVSHVI